MSFLAKITGLGLVTPLGRSVASTWTALLAGQSVNQHSPLPVSKSSPFCRVTSLAMRAASEAITEAGWNCTADDANTALIVGTSKGPVERWVASVPPSLPSDQLKPPARQTNFGLAEMSTDIARQTGIVAGPRLTVSSACASGLHALIRGCMMIQSGQVQRALIVAAEASLHPLFIASFERLGVLSPAGMPCRPFNISRQGFLISDAAAAICVEASEDKGIYIDGFGMAGDATHLTGSKSDGRILTRVLDRVMPAAVDLIQAHGTGTLLNDAIEINALHSVLRAHATLYSHKGAIGHSLGASGLVSVVLNCLMHRYGTVPGNVNTPDPIKSNLLGISQTSQSQKVRTSIAIASGFGGATSAVRLSTRDHS